MKKALTIRQPWATLIALGIKDVENRTWQSHFRGTFYIHAASAPLKAGPESFFTQDQLECLKKCKIVSPDGSRFLIDFPTGALLGTAEVSDCVKEDNSIWKEPGTRGLKLDNIHIFENPIENVKGNLGFWNLDEKALK